MNEQEPFSPGRFVTDRIYRLVGKDPTNLSPTSRAQLAQLRQAVDKGPGTVASIWPITCEGVPDGFRGQRLERIETAVHIALTQFAVHQQSRSRLMHDPQQPFGRAVRKLAEATFTSGEPYESPAYRRFTTLSTTTALPGILSHLGSLVTQLRSNDIPFDYGRFTYDLLLLQDPGRNAQARRTWGRDFHRLTTSTSNNSQ